MAAGGLVLVTGGCRSGKSGHALTLAEREAGGRILVATCPVLDGEMAERVRRHREERAGRGWETVEEEVELAAVLRRVPAEAVVVVDCLTLWVNNLLYVSERVGERAGEWPDEDAVAALAAGVAAAAAARRGLTICVSNEVGLGIVPENALARRFRDLAGRVNQTLAARAEAVYFMVAGLPMRIK